MGCETAFINYKMTILIAFNKFMLWSPIALDGFMVIIVFFPILFDDQ